jgi:magnesium chelatase family protein
VKKEGTAFDLPIALGLLVATAQLPAESLARHLFVGELGLDGTLRAIRGGVPIARHAATLRDTVLVLPLQNADEAALVTGLPIAAPATLSELVEQFRRNGAARAHLRQAPSRDVSPSALDFADVVGQESARRALEVAAAGGHNAILVGPPGAGKTMLARRLPSILPELTEAEALDVVAIHSVAGALAPDALATRVRPFRAPHHTISEAGLIGGGSVPRPGEVSLAHQGVLFLDEMLEFPRHVLEGLRQPMEDGRVVVARAAASVTFPARFTLVGAMNPCPCGHAGDAARACVCAAADVARYRARLSGPLADRIDMHVTVGAVPLRTLGAAGAGESSAAVRQRVERARAAQRARYAAAGLRSVRCNAHAPGRWLDTRTPVDRAARELLGAAAERLALSARGYHRVLKVARTVADLEGAESVTTPCVAEALRYRPAAGGAAVVAPVSPRRHAAGN